MADLQALPEGEWFCSPTCEHVFQNLQILVARGPIPLTLMGLEEGEGRSWQVLRGRKGEPANGRTLSAVVEMFSVSVGRGLWVIRYGLWVIGHGLLFCSWFWVLGSGFSVMHDP